MMNSRIDNNNMLLEKSVMRKLYIAFTYAFLFLLAACNGSSDSSSSPDTDPPVQTTLSVVLSDQEDNSKTSFTKNESIVVSATVRDQYGKGMANVRVDFSSDLGELTPDSKLTDANGVALIAINNAALAIGAGTLTSTTSSLSATNDFEYTEPTSVETSLTVAFLDAENNAKNSFGKNEIITVNATLHDQFGEGIANTSVNFSADLGTVSADSVTTNAEGVASITISNAQFETGAGTLAASTAELNTSGDYEYLEIPSVQTTLDIELFDATQVAKNSFARDEVVTVKATIKDQFNQVMPNIRVNFSTDLGQLSPDSRLTDENGVAETTIANANFTIGAGTLDVTTELLTSAKDYEYTSSDVVEPTPSLTVAMEVNGQLGNQFTTAEVALVKATFVDDAGEPINDAIVRFTADVGELSTSSALTKNGVASVNITADPDLNIGAGVLIATVDGNSEISTRTHCDQDAK